MRIGLILLATAGAFIGAALLIGNSKADRPAQRVGTRSQIDAPASRNPIFRVQAATRPAASDATGDFGYSPYEQFALIHGCSEGCVCGAGCGYIPDFRTARIGDVTGDGRDDLVGMPYSNNDIYVWPQHPDGTFDTANPLDFRFGTDNYLAATSVVLGDVNEDGVDDVVASSMDPIWHTTGGITVLLSDGHGGLTLSVIPPMEYYGVLSGEWFDPRLTDVDLDGHLDLVAFLNYAPQLSEVIFFGDGKGAFGRAKIVAIGPIPDQETIVDLNDDGLDDVAVVEHLNDPVSNPRLNVYFNSPQGFSAETPLKPDRAAAGLWFGDFNHDGRTDIAAYALIMLQGPAVTFPTTYQVPSGAMYPAVGLATDLDGDGLTDLLSPQFYMGITGEFLQPYLQQGGTLRPTGMGPVLAGIVEEREMLAAGDLNSDGCKDVAMASGQSGVLVFHGQNCQHASATSYDFDGDRKSDLFWNNATTGGNDIWRSSNVAHRIYMKPAAADWFVAGTGDFDGDRKVDILWRNRVTGANIYWRSGSSRLSVALTTVAGSDWSIAGVGDIDGNGRADILWHQASTGANRLWPDGKAASMRALTAVTGLDWSVNGIADFDGDHRGDVLWHNRVTGASTIWSGGDYARRRSLTTITDPAWVIMAVGDFDGDGKSDLFWRNLSTGSNAIWGGGDFAARRAVTSVTEQAWTVQTVADYNADGKTDFFWRNSSTGADIIWFSGRSDWRLPVAPVKNIQWQAR
jgi:hypothetical protein